MQLRCSRGEYTGSPWRWICAWREWRLVSLARSWLGIPSHTLDTMAIWSDFLSCFSLVFLFSPLIIGCLDFYLYLPCFNIDPPLDCILSAAILCAFHELILIFKRSLAF